MKLIDIAFTGMNLEEKLKCIREDLKDNKCHAIFLNKLEDIMWLYNLRGSDIKHCPLALSFAFVDMDYAYIFLKEEAVSEAVRAYLANYGVIICDYEDVYVFLTDYPYSGSVLIDDRNVSVNAYRAILKAGASVHLAPSTSKAIPFIFFNLSSQFAIINLTFQKSSAKVVKKKRDN